MGDAAADEGRGDGHTPEYAIGLGRDWRRARWIRVERDQVTPGFRRRGRLAVGARREGLARRDGLGGVPRLAFVGRPVHRRGHSQRSPVRNTSDIFDKADWDRPLLGSSQSRGLHRCPPGPVSGDQERKTTLLSMGLA